MKSAEADTGDPVISFTITYSEAYAKPNHRIMSWYEQMREPIDNRY
jgi:hypothetical protein